MSAPFFPLYASDFVNDEAVVRLELEETGAFFLLLCRMWLDSKKTCSVPDDAAWCSKALGIGRARWARIREALVESDQPVLHSVDGRLFNKRLREEFKKFSEKSQKFSENSKRRWGDDFKIDGKKANKINETPHATALPPQSHGNQYTDTDIYTDTTKTIAPTPSTAEKKNSRVRAVVQRPDGVSEQVWGDFLAVRRAKKAATTETALAGIIREAGKAGISLQSALEICCQRGWAGFKAEWAQNLALTATKKAQTPAQAATANISQYANIPGFE